MYSSARNPRKRRVWRDPPPEAYDPLDPPPSFGTALRRVWETGVGRFRQRCPPARRLAPKRSEKVEQHAIKCMFNDLGFVAYYDTSQPFEAAITHGLPDLLCFDTRCTPWRFFVVECKKRGGYQTCTQHIFQVCCERAGIDYILGTVADVGRYLGLESYAEE